MVGRCNTGRTRMTFEISEVAIAPRCWALCPWAARLCSAGPANWTNGFLIPSCHGRVLAAQAKFSPCAGKFPGPAALDFVRRDFSWPEAQSSTGRTPRGRERVESVGPSRPPRGRAGPTARNVIPSRLHEVHHGAGEKVKRLSIDSARASRPCVSHMPAGGSIPETSRARRPCHYAVGSHRKRFVRTHPGSPSAPSHDLISTA